MIALTDLGGGFYQLNFTNTSAVGIYNITILANDTFDNINNSFSTAFDITTFRLLDVIDKTGLPVSSELSIINQLGVMYNVSILPHNHSINELLILGYNNSVSNINEVLIQNSTNDAFFNKSFSSDLSRITFDTSNLTFASTGKHLFKCTNFSFTTQSCLDDEDYLQIRTDLIPGQNYTIILNSTDPGFGITIEGSENISDAHMRSGRPDNNYGGTTNIRVGRRTASNMFRGAISFNLSHIATDAHIYNATLSLHFNSIPGTDNTGSRTHGVHKIQQSPTRDWQELETTWNDYSTGNTWTSAGGDYSGTPTDIQTFSSAEIGTRIEYNVTADVQDFVTNSTINFGWIIKDQSETANNWRADYASSENNNFSLHPVLTIYYEIDDSPNLTEFAPIGGANFNASYDMEIGINITDDFGVDTVLANLTMSNGTNQMLELTQAPGTDWYNISYTIPWVLGQYNITFIVNDTSSNVNDTVTTYFISNDGTPPELTDSRPLAGSNYNFSNIIEIGANVTDHIGVGTVLANITFPNTTSVIIELTQVAATDWYNSSYTVPSIFGQYDITFIANDTSNNINDSATTYFIVPDDKAPSVIDPAPAEGTIFNYFTTIEIGANVTDIAIVDTVLANLTLPGGSSTIIQLSQVGGTDWYKQ